ncbi:MAG: hypothetical protein ACYDEB_11955 [Dehalococcoidia bacterium]
MADVSHSTQAMSASPVLVYGWPGGDDLVFAPLEEARRYAALRSADGFPMSWRAFRERFGDDAYEEAVAELIDDADYASFEEFFQQAFVREAYSDGTLTGPCDWERWYADYRERVGPLSVFAGTLHADPRLNVPERGRYCTNLLDYWDDVTRFPEVAADELPDWFQWYSSRLHGDADKSMTLEQFRRQIEAGIARNAANLEAELGPQARQEYEELPVGCDGRAPTDDDEASFHDCEGNVFDSPRGLSYFPAQLMLNWFPSGLARRFGRERDTVHDGPYLELDSGRCDEIVAALEALGFTCVEDGRLLAVACGY